MEQQQSVTVIRLIDSYSSSIKKVLATSTPGRYSKTYKRYLHSDGYNAYRHYGSLPGVTHVNCNAHVRRKFHKAKFTDRKRPEHALDLYGKLYGIESYFKEQNLSFDDRKRIQ